MTGQKFEYRVRWRREGRSQATKHYQTLKGAQGCVERQRSAHEEMDWAEVPPLAVEPTVEQREVGAWEPVE